MVIVSLLSLAKTNFLAFKTTWLAGNVFAKLLYHLEGLMFIHIYKMAFKNQVKHQPSTLPH